MHDHRDIAEGALMKLEGLTILAVEDEPVISLVLEDLLESCGARPLVAETIDHAEALLDTMVIDAAILDVNLQGRDSYPLAALLTERGLPFIFATGYGDALHPGRFAGVPTTAKPYNLGDLEAAFAAL
jgi:DNA-binding response OmpR family regulator